LTRIGFVHVTEPGFEAGGSEIRTRRLYEAVRQFVPHATLSMVPGAHRPPWAPARLRAAVHGMPLRLSRLDDPWTGAVDAVVNGSDLTVASSTFTASAIAPERLAKVVLDAHNIEWQVNRQLAISSTGIIRRAAYSATTSWLKRYESRLSASVAGVWAVSASEAEWFEGLGVPVWIVPNGVDPPAETDPTPESHRLLFVGSLNSIFNRQGLDWLFARVWPQLIASVPDVSLAIAGAGPRLDVPEGVDQLGFVEDLRSLYSHARICLAPLLSGAGTRLKVLEAMAYARPVVATTIGAEGLPFGEADGVLIADDAEKFTLACRRILLDADGASEYGRRARLKALEYSWARIASVAVDSLRDLSLT
jgi:polysaccharide biosynthesis protein PslH